jgi:hypothetical protein
MNVFASWVRDATLSFLNTLRRRKSTVAGLTNNCAAMSRLRYPSLTSRGDLSFLRSQHIGGTGDPLADVFTGRIQPDPGPLCRTRTPGPAISKPGISN